MNFERPFRVDWLNTVDSTNSELKRRLSSDLPPGPGTILATSDQTAGRGRAGRNWVSARDRNLCFSIYVASSASAMLIPSLGMAAALAVDDVLRGLGVESRPKWPNDLRVDGRKIGGILSERPAGGGAIVGIGININMTSAEALAIDQPATSILIETGREHAPQAVLDLLLNPLAKRIEAWRGSAFEGIRNDWCARVEGLGSEVEIRDGKSLIDGVLQDFGSHGECLLRTPNGDLHAIWSGDLA